ncbi:MAG: type IV secretory system conjugative DNA transfer family protein, partial [Sphingomonas sp.]|nr:type IV secretory system conjugative DNA transfer family protein [Sphingomonas sp.]
DERTARRISDALGQATEQRAMRNYAGHRLAPWLAHVMVSRQETARPLLTQGEVMQLPPADELVMIAGLPPIRAKKLRYYEDRNFAGRILPPPALGLGRYADAPPPRTDDWQALVRGADARLQASEADPNDAADGGLEQQRHPGLSEESTKKPELPRQLDLLGFDRDDADPVSDKKAMDRSRTVSANTVVRAHAINEGDGRDHDALPSF